MVQRVLIPPVSISDDFNRAALGSMWDVKQDSGGHGIISSVRYGNTNTTDGRKYIVHTTRMNTDNMFVEYTQAAASNARRLGAMLCVAEDYSSWLALLTNSTNMIVVRGAGTPGWEDANVTILNTIPGSVANGAKVGLRITNGVVQAYYNGLTSGSSFTYTGPTGPNYRRVGVQCSRGSFVSSPPLDDFTAGDI